MNPRKSYLHALPLALMLSQTAQAENVRLHGALVAEPCVIAPGGESVTLDFGSLIDKDLYTNQRTRSKPFDIRLMECDVSLGKTVKVTFSGIENPHLAGLLAIDGGGQAKGIAIGMETQGGQKLPLNKPGEGVRLVNGSNTLTMLAFVQGEPAAIANKTIERGPFSAIATFSLEYE
ncbi:MULTISPECIES: fimbrial protein [unclassified Pseudomonas]|uniref:fimbrial protein n=1 Tax=unclassified Pseudomonas TaxID=196821 RepID=UPI001F362E1D|nr:MULTISPECIES: fimbrial protein [unclassified Pseudomonas]MCF5228505.1 fimbrial protein [Pseudomonas sp. PA-5-4H]MCF5235701.1 fimbrial protein [Pseudomonas sp. PA-5-4G]MCF5247364.1 fimbrial protein [Pseudomonas sp. PA-5-4B]MCF5253514.1 fimbrial protein [Pseudomonas sp. PA-5-4B]MCF5261519.1 fimbrial protein [Pseudomonas sp. PA-5-4A]